MQISEFCWDDVGSVLAFFQARKTGLGHMSNWNIH